MRWVQSNKCLLSLMCDRVVWARFLSFCENQLHVLMTYLRTHISGNCRPLIIGHAYNTTSHRFDRIILFFFVRRGEGKFDWNRMINELRMTHWQDPGPEKYTVIKMSDPIHSKDFFFGVSRAASLLYLSLLEYSSFRFVSFRLGLMVSDIFFGRVLTRLKSSRSFRVWRVRWCRSAQNT